MDLIKNHPKKIGFISIIISIFLFMRFVEFLMMSSVIAILEPEKLGGSDFFFYVSEMFFIQYYLNIPALILLIFGIYCLRIKIN